MTKNGTGPAGHGLEFDNVLDMFAATVALSLIHISEPTRPY